nr:MAG TPA: hypothetical protein [Caudoviricetes sp.]
MFWGHFAIQYHVLRAACTVFQCFACDIIRLRKPQGAGQHPTPCGFCIARLRQGNTFSDQQPEYTSRAICLLSSGTVRVCTPAGPLNRRGFLDIIPQCA